MRTLSVQTEVVAYMKTKFSRYRKKVVVLAWPFILFY